MIAFRDFSAIEFGRPEGIDRALVEANEWLLHNRIKPLNIETLRKASGGGLAQITYSDVGLRIWYAIDSATTIAR